MKILVIDDDAELLDNIGIILEMAGYEVLRAENGLAGLRLAHEQQPNLIICDVMMPDMSGYEVLEELQSNSATSILPFIFLTSMSALEDIRRGMLSGADDYLTKPFSEENLLAAVQKRFEKWHRFELEQQRRFSQEQLQGQEKYFAQLAEELDEGLRKKISYLKFWADSQNLNPNTSKEMLFSVLDKSLNSVLSELNRISYQLYPAMLPELGLTLSLEWLFNQRSKMGGAPIKFEVYAMDRRLESKLEFGIYRIVQRIIEQLADSIDEFSVVLWQDEDTVHLSLSQLPNLDKQDYWHLFHLLEVYAHAMQASLTIQHDETHTAIYLKLANAIFQESIIPEVPKIMLDKLVNILAVSSDKDFLQALNLDFEFKYKMSNYLFVDLDSLFNQINLFQPQITILDTLIAPEILKLLSQKTILVLLSSNYDESFARQALQEGVMAIIPKLRVERELIPAIHTILQGEAYISASLFMNRRKTEAKTSLNLDALLTLREREILDLILADLTHADIAARLVISPRTVEKHRANIMQKLGLNTHTELILFALRHGFIAQH